MCDTFQISFFLSKDDMFFPLVYEEFLFLASVFMHLKYYLTTVQLLR